MRALLGKTNEAVKLTRSDRVKAALRGLPLYLFGGKYVIPEALQATIEDILKR